MSNDEELNISADEIAAEAKEEEDTEKEQEQQEAQQQGPAQANNGMQQAVAGAVGQDLSNEVNLEELPDEKKERWVEELILGDEVVDTRELAGGKIELELAINTGQDSLDITKQVEKILDNDENPTPRYFQTAMALINAAHAIKTVNGKVPGGEGTEAKFEWLKGRSAILTDEILREYQMFEAEITALLREEGIKKS